MANLRDIRRRIKSVKSTAQITKAMQLVAASKMKKAQDQATSGRAYADLLNKILVNLKEKTEDISHPLLEEKEEGKDLFLLVATDKGLCGGLNTNLFKKLEAVSTKDAGYVAIGRKGAAYIGKSGKELIADFPVSDPAKFADIKPIAKFITEQYLEGGYKRVFVVFTNFVNTISQIPHSEQLLPLSPFTLGEIRGYEGVGGDDEVKEVSKEDSKVGYLFEPSAAEVLETVLPQFINNSIYQMVLEAHASEHSARMVAMKGATDNANSMVKDLTLEYNKVRQAAITNELLEITTAMKALE